MGTTKYIKQNNPEAARRRAIARLEAVAGLLDDHPGGLTKFDISARLRLSQKLTEYALSELRKTGRAAYLINDDRFTVWAPVAMIPVLQVKALAAGRARRALIDANKDTTLAAARQPRTAAIAACMNDDSPLYDFFDSWPVVRIIKPAGQWQADHGRLINSVFALGAAA